MLFKLDYFYDNLFHCVQFSNVEYQDEIFQTYDE